jgi:hypothetical protein
MNKKVDLPEVDPSRVKYVTIGLPSATIYIVIGLVILCQLLFTGIVCIKYFGIDVTPFIGEGILRDILTTSNHE